MGHNTIRIKEDRMFVTGNRLVIPSGLFEGQTEVNLCINIVGKQSGCGLKRFNAFIKSTIVLVEVAQVVVSPRPRELIMSVKWFYLDMPTCGDWV